MIFSFIFHVYKKFQSFPSIFVYFKNDKVKKLKEIEVI